MLSRLGCRGCRFSFDFLLVNISSSGRSSNILFNTTMIHLLPPPHLPLPLSLPWLSWHDTNGILVVKKKEWENDENGQQERDSLQFTSENEKKNPFFSSNLCPCLVVTLNPLSCPEGKENFLLLFSRCLPLYCIFTALFLSNIVLFFLLLLNRNVLLLLLVRHHLLWEVLVLPPLPCWQPSVTN